MSTVAAQVFGTFVGTVTFEARVALAGSDTSPWVAIPAQNVTTGASATTATAAGVYQADIAAFSEFRARISAYTSGTITVVGIATLGEGQSAASLPAGSATEEKQDAQITQLDSILSNTASIVTNTGNIANNTAAPISIATPGDPINVVVAAGATEATTATIADNTANIRNDTTEITTNTSSIVGSTDTIVTNTAAIVNNTLDTVTNTAGIANIVTNTAAIAASLSNSFSHITTNTTTTPKASPGVLHSVTINTLGVGNAATIKDDATVIAIINTTTAQVTLVFDVAFATSLVVVTAGGTPADITVIYR